MVQLGFALGNIYRLLGKIDVVEFIQGLNIDALEWTYGYNFNERVVTEKEAEYLQSLSYLSAHAPFRWSLKYDSRKELDAGLNFIKEQNKLVDFESIVIHPQNIFPKNYLCKSALPFITENMNPKKGASGRRTSFEKVLAENKEWGLCLDVNHAYDWSGAETERIISKYKRRIREVHLSNNRYGVGHCSFEKVTKAYCKSLEPLRELSCPIIVEEDMVHTNQNQVRAELERIRALLF